MTQTRLREEDAEDISKAVDMIAGAFVWHDTDEGHKYWDDVAKRLLDKARNRTSDGKPYIEPEPPIPEGWRKANADEWRRKDVKYWDLRHKDWRPRRSQGIAFDSDSWGTSYIVPIDPPLTDEDACVLPRLKVMVRDYETEEWHGPYRYLGKNAKESYPYIVDTDRSNSRTWKQARRATPEEIEAAK